MSVDVTEIKLDERGDETHESWLLIRANRATTTGAWLFDSEIKHREVIMVTVTRCTRKRELNRDYLFGTERLIDIEMSQAQWGAFVSSFGNGSGVPATLRSLQGEHVPQAPAESRFDESHAEVRDAGAKALDEIADSYAKVMAAFEAGGKRALREALKSLGYTIQNGPPNMEFAAKSLTEHVENVVTKARADIEGMVLAAEQFSLPPSAPFQLEGGTDDRGTD